MCLELYKADIRRHNVSSNAESPGGLISLLCLSVVAFFSLVAYFYPDAQTGYCIVP